MVRITLENSERKVALAAEVSSLPELLEKVVKPALFLIGYEKAHVQDLFCDLDCPSPFQNPDGN